MEPEYTTQEYKAPVALSSLLPKLPTKKSRKLTPRQELISKTCYELGIPQSYATGLFFQCKDIFTDDEITALKEKALGWQGKTLESKARWFRSMVKEKRKEIKAKLDNERD